MCNNNSLNNQIDQERLLYTYQGMNAIFKMLNKYLDQSGSKPISPYDNADSGKVIAMAFQAYKNGKITMKQYEEIFDIATGMQTVETTATSEPSWDEQLATGIKFLSQFGG